MLLGPEREDHTLYSSHTVWADKASFTAWTTSEQFRASHGGTGQHKPLYLGHPEFEGFEVIQTVSRPSSVMSQSLGRRTIEPAVRADVRVSESRQIAVPVRRTCGN